MTSTNKGNSEAEKKKEAKSFPGSCLFRNEGIDGMKMACFTCSKEKMWSYKRKERIKNTKEQACLHKLHSIPFKTTLFSPIG